MSKWIRFEKNARPKDRKTDTWDVYSLGKPALDDEGYTELGVIRWIPGWRRYGFAPHDQTIYEAECLRDLAAFCETETKKHKTGEADPPKENG